MVKNDSGEAIVAFVGLPKTIQIAQPMNFIPQIQIQKGPHQIAK